MSFGFGVGDFLAVGQLVLTLYNACEGAPEEFQALRRDLSSIHIVLSGLESQAKDPNSPLRLKCGDRKPEWVELKQNLESTLVELQKIVDKYNNMGKNAWLRVRLGLQDLNNLRGKLALHLNAINTFNGSLTLSAVGRMEPVLGRIELMLKEFVREERAGQKEPTVLKALETDDDIAWKQMKLDLILGGISKEEFEKYEDRIKELVAWVIKNEGDLRGLGEVDVDESVSQRNSIESEIPSTNDQQDSTQQNLILSTDVASSSSGLRVPITTYKSKVEVYNVKILIVDDNLGRKQPTKSFF
jgi:hypothetical protein